MSGAFREMVIDALEEMKVKPTSKNVLVMMGLLRDVLKVVEAKCEMRGSPSRGEKGDDQA